MSHFTGLVVLTAYVISRIMVSVVAKSFVPLHAIRNPLVIAKLETTNRVFILFNKVKVRKHMFLL